MSVLALFFIGLGIMVFGLFGMAASRYGVDAGWYKNLMNYIWPYILFSVIAYVGFACAAVHALILMLHCIKTS